MEPRRILTQTPAREGNLGYHAYVPRTTGDHPPLVVVHGDSRRSGQQFRSFLPAAMEHEIPLVAPHFDTDRFTGYQRLSGSAHAFSALDAWHRLLDELAVDMDLDTARVDLFGFAGGAQFAHRAALMSPERVHRLVVTSAGWFTWLDSTQEFPYGVATTGLTGRTPKVRDFLSLSILVLAGEHDIDRDGKLRTSPRIDRRQGPNRLMRALAWIDHLEKRATAYDLPCSVEFDVLEQCRNSFRDTVATAGLVQRVMAFVDPASAALGALK